MPVPDSIVDLVERFERNIEDYRSGDYKEARVRAEFIDPFFEALGWDVRNAAGYAEAYKDVIHEDSMKVGPAAEAPDYCFRIGGARKFFVEAKRPGIAIESGVRPAYQLRRYAWSAKLPLSILTSFREFALYDCRVKPSNLDKPSVARVMHLNHTDYAARWDEIAAILAKDAILKGSFDKYADSARAKRGTTQVDDAFLKEIESWRDMLARSIANRNPALSQRELNFAVQRTIDRIVFLRICEDRGTENYAQLMGLVNAPRVYERLLGLFRQADDRYNSGLFHFQRETGRAETPDELTLSLNVDDTPLRSIIKSLYYPDSPYEFSVLPGDILGQVYEQFLGRVIRLTAGHQAKVEDKPEVKKAGGVYYTPTYIVDYIVKNTVGKLLEGKTPKEVEKLRILDPACGSGSFLIAAYQFLLDWHAEWYAGNDPEKWARAKTPRVYSDRAGWRLTNAERKRILVSNIFGVDIDSQAVEVTKLSLLLKILEKQGQLQLGHERMLPDLGGNIKCGNSLIGPDFHSNPEAANLDADERLRINAFDWQAEFPDAMKAGGFDAVIGNPPYVRIQTLTETAPEQARYLKTQFQSAQAGNYDIYVTFLERGLDLLNPRGRLGFITPSKFMTTDYGAPLRGLIAQRGVLEALVDFGHAQVFENATTYTCLVFLTHARGDAATFTTAAPRALTAQGVARVAVPDTALASGVWTGAGPTESALFAKAEAGCVRLSEVPVLMCRGSSSGADDVFCVNESAEGFVTRQGVPVDLEPEMLKQPIYATDFGRFHFARKNREFIVFPYQVSESAYAPIPEPDFRAAYPKAYAYLKSRRAELENRRQYAAWYAYSAPRSLHRHNSADALVPLLANRGLCAPCPSDMQRYCVMASAGFSLSVVPSEYQGSSLYLMALVNSRLLFWYLRQISNKFRGGWITCTRQYFGTLPIRSVDFADPADKARHDRIVAVVDQMLALHKQLADARLEQEKTAIQRQIDALDRRIDLLVYELYGLTDEEIAIVEGSTA